jgi:hypothetical protein
MTPDTSREEEIREYAYRLWQLRLENNIEGDALSDWLEAEYRVAVSKPGETT